MTAFWGFRCRAAEYADADGKELEKRSSVSLYWRKGIRLGCCKLAGVYDKSRPCLTLSLLVALLCICRYWPRYIRLLLIFPASVSVVPAVLASLARLLPVRSIIRECASSLWCLITVLPPTFWPLLDFDAEKAVALRAYAVAVKLRNHSLVSRSASGWAAI